MTTTKRTLASLLYRHACGTEEWVRVFSWREHHEVSARMAQRGSVLEREAFADDHIR